MALLTIRVAQMLAGYLGIEAFLGVNLLSRFAHESLQMAADLSLATVDLPCVVLPHRLALCYCPNPFAWDIEASSKPKTVC